MNMFCQSYEPFCAVTKTTEISIVKNRRKSAWKITKVVERILNLFRSVSKAKDVIKEFLNHIR